MDPNNLNEADQPAPESGSTAAPDNANITPGEQEPPKTFTQEELNKIVAAEKAKAKRQAERALREELEQAAQRKTAPEPPRPDQFRSTEDYAEALAEHKANQKLAEREAREQRKQVESTYIEREEEARSKYDDFEKVAYNPDLSITEIMAEAIKGSDLGPEVAYYLGKNPDEARRIARLAPLAQAKEIGKIEVSLSSNPPVKKTSSAPDPIKPVGSRSSVPSLDPTDPRSAEKMPVGDWIEARNAQIAKKLRAQ